MFTWCNGRRNDERIWERLDRALANDRWRRMFPYATVTHEIVSYSDHNPVLLALNDKRKFATTHGKKKRLFRFETLWVQEAECGDIVEQNWKSVSTQGTTEIAENLRNLQMALQKWGKDKFGSISKKILKTKEV